MISHVGKSHSVSCFKLNGIIYVFHLPCKSVFKRIFQISLRNTFRKDHYFPLFYKSYFIYVKLFGKKQCNYKNIALFSLLMRPLHCSKPDLNFAGVPRESIYHLGIVSLEIPQMEEIDARIKSSKQLLKYAQIETKRRKRSK